MKMDHHCPWINNCVGHKNHKRFTLFLFFVVIGCSYAAISLIGCVVQIFSIVGIWCLMCSYSVNDSKACFNQFPATIKLGCPCVK